VEETQKL